MSSEQVWTVDLEKTNYDTPDNRVIVGNVFRLGPFTFGTFCYVNDLQSGFTFLSVNHTNVCFNWNW